MILAYQGDIVPYGQVGYKRRIRRDKTDAEPVARNKSLKFPFQVGLAFK